MEDESKLEGNDELKSVGDVNSIEVEETVPPVEPKPKHRSLKFFGFAGAITAFVVAGVFLVINRPGSVLSALDREVADSVLAIADLDSFTGNYSVAVDEGQSGTNLAGEFRFDGSNFAVDLSTEYQSELLGFDVVIYGEEAFIKVEGLEALLGPTFDAFTDSQDDNPLLAYDGAWISLSSDDVTDSGLLPQDTSADELDTAVVDELISALDDYDFFDAENSDETLQLGSEVLQGYDIILNLDELSKLYAEASETLGEYVGEDVLEEGVQLEEDLSEANLEGLTLFSDGERLRSLKIEDIEDGQSFVLEVNLDEVNVPVEIEQPVADFGFEDVFTLLFTLLLGSSF